MKKEEACRRIDNLDYYLQHYTSPDYSECDHEAMMMAKKALEQEPIEPVIESAYKTGYKMGRSITMIESVR